MLLDGPVITSELTGKNGKVDLHRRPRRHLSRAHRQARLHEPDVGVVRSARRPGRHGCVRAGSRHRRPESHRSRSPSKRRRRSRRRSIDQNSPQRRLSDDLAGALNKLSGVSVTTCSDDSDATQTISLEGHDPSQTALTLDGIPLNAPGIAGNLRGFATDLFQGASVHTGAALGGLGGSVNFTTLQPTLSWMSQTAALGRQLRQIQLFAGRNRLDRKTRLRGADRLPARSEPRRRRRTFSTRADSTTITTATATISGNLLKLRYEFGDSNALTGTLPELDAQHEHRLSALQGARRRCRAATGRTTPTTATCSSTH